MSFETKNRNILKNSTKTSLFVTSFSPLFLLIIIKQICQNYDKYIIDFTKLSNYYTFIQNYGISFVLILLLVYGFIGAIYSYIGFNKFLINGTDCKIIDVKNRNSETISYIGTYIIPFLFQTFNTFIDLISIIILLLIIYKIYINSDLILINPILNFFKFSIFDIDFIDNEYQLKKHGLIITRNRDLDDNDNIKMIKIGHKMYFSNR